MAECLFSLAVTYFILIIYAKNFVRLNFSLILQFIVGWLILELAWVHGLISAISLIMAIGDLDDWTFGTVLGFALSCYNIVLFWQILKQGENSVLEFDKSLLQDLGEDYKDKILPERKSLIDNDPGNKKWLKPFSFSSPHIESVKNITYGPNHRNTLDLFKPKTLSDTPRPVMLQIHGGGWMLGYGERQGLPLRNKLVEAGWIFVSINYRLSPDHKFPAHLIDCKQSLRWIKENIADYGGDPNFVMTTGGSAGGHLCSLLALTANKETEQLQPGFENTDTSVNGSIPMYGVYDFSDRNGHRTDMPMIDFLEDKVMPYSMDEDPDIWELASPIAQTHADRPPFMVIHGELDTLSFVDDARHFVKALQETSDAPCVYTELPQTQHAFEIFYSPRCIHAIYAMHTFAEYVYSDYLTKKLDKPKKKTTKKPAKK